MTCSIRAPMIPPMMHQVATDRIASPSSPSLRPHRQVRYTATATATKVKKPCQDSMNPAVRMMSGSKGMLITARISIGDRYLRDRCSGLSSLGSTRDRALGESSAQGTPTPQWPARTRRPGYVHFQKTACSKAPGLPRIAAAGVPLPPPPCSIRLPGRERFLAPLFQTRCNNHPTSTAAGPAHPRSPASWFHPKNPAASVLGTSWASWPLCYPPGSPATFPTPEVPPAA